MKWCLLMFFAHVWMGWMCWWSLMLGIRAGSQGATSGRGHVMLGSPAKSEVSSICECRHGGQHPTYWAYCDILHHKGTFALRKLIPWNHMLLMLGEAGCSLSLVWVLYFFVNFAILDTHRSDNQKAWLFDIIWMGPFFWTAPVLFVLWCWMACTRPSIPGFHSFISFAYLLSVRQIAVSSAKQHPNSFPGSWAPWDPRAPWVTWA